MKKILLHVSLAFTVAYVLLSAAVLAFQRELKYLWGVSEEVVASDVYPLLQIAGVVVTAAIAILFYFLLLNAEKSLKAWAETTAVVVLTAVLLVSPYLLLAGNVVENGILAQYGPSMIANYSVLSSLLSIVRPLSYVPYLLMIIFSGISIGVKRADGAGR